MIPDYKFKIIIEMKQPSNYYLKRVGQYNLIREIGSGSFARVYKGRSDQNEDVAIKMISKQTVRTENVAIIEKEIDILLKLDHPNVIKLLDFKKTSNHYYLVFEFCEYGDLDQYIRKNTEHHKLPESEVRGIIQQLSSAMHKMHSLRMVHRDLKLANILLNKGFQIKLADFGFAKYTEDNQFLTSYCGTPLTMAPEVLKREKYTDKCDIWSVGVIIYQMLFGMAPFQPPKGGMINDLLNVINNTELTFPETTPTSPLVRQLITSMLKKDWRQRIGFLEFFQHKWLHESIQGDNQYLKSLHKASQELSPKVENLPQHKLSDDLTEQVGERDDSFSEAQKDHQLRYLGSQILYEVQTFLKGYMESIMQISDLCLDLQDLYQKQEPSKELKSLILSIKVLKAQRLAQGLGYKKDMVVLIQNSSTRSDLITLQLEQAITQIYEHVSKQIMELQTEFVQQMDTITGFINSHYSVADNLYNQFLEFLTALLKQERLIVIDQAIIDKMFELLAMLIANPPVESALECRISLQQTSDMKRYWHLFKLLKTEQQKLQEIIDDRQVGAQPTMDLQVKIACSSCPIDPEEQGVGFTLADLSILKNSLLEKMKDQTMIVIS